MPSNLSADITYRKANSVDYPAILALYNSSYNANRTVSDLEWLYTRNPAGQATVFIALYDDKVVGMQSVLPYEFHQNRETILTYKSEDSLVHADHRGHGIYGELYRMVHDFVGDKLLWGLTHLNKVLEKVDMPSSHRFISAISLNPKHKMRGDSFFSLKHFFKRYVFVFQYMNSLVKPKIDTKDHKFEIAKNLDFYQFSKEIAADNDLMVPVLSSQYIRWRVEENPAYDEGIIGVSRNDNDEIIAVSLIAIVNNRGRWLGTYFREDTPQSDVVLHIERMTSHLFQEGISDLKAWLFDCNGMAKKTAYYLKKSGFVTGNKGLYIVHNDSKSIYNANYVLFSMLMGIK